VGEKEVASGAVSVRLRHGGDAGSMAVEEFLASARQAIERKSKEVIAEVKNR
jgi:threonyl-tRNA synthetase